MSFPLPPKETVQWGKLSLAVQDEGTYSFVPFNLLSITVEVVNVLMRLV